MYALHRMLKSSYPAPWLICCYHDDTWPQTCYRQTFFEQSPSITCNVKPISKASSRPYPVSANTTNLLAECLKSYWRWCHTGVKGAWKKQINHQREWYHLEICVDLMKSELVKIHFFKNLNATALLACTTIIILFFLNKRFCPFSPGFQASCCTLYQEADKTCRLCSSKIISNVQQRVRLKEIVPFWITGKLAFIIWNLPY